MIWSKPYWSVAGWIYLLIVGRIRDPSTFATGQRSEIGRYEVTTEVPFPGFSIGMINQDFHIADMFQRSRHTRGGTVRQQTMPANRDHYYPDSLLFVSAGFLPRVSSQRLN